MAGKLGKFQKQTFNYWKGDTLKKHHMGAIFLRKPQMATELMVQLLAWHKGKTLNTFLSQFNTKTFESDDEYTWQVIGSSARNIPLVEARDCDGNIVSASTANNILYTPLPHNMSPTTFFFIIPVLSHRITMHFQNIFQI